MTAGFPIKPNDPFLKNLRAAYQGVDGYLLSSLGRQGLPPEEKETLTYGELPVPVFLELMERIGLGAGASFIDLGAGLGQLVLAAAYHFDLKRATGIECVNELVSAARNARENLRGERFRTKDIELLSGDIKDVGWGEYDVLLAHATCYSEETLRYLASGLMKIKPRGRMLVLGQELKGAEAYLAETFTYQTRWHRHGTAYLYARP